MIGDHIRRSAGHEAHEDPGPYSQGLRRATRQNPLWAY